MLKFVIFEGLVASIMAKFEQIQWERLEKFWKKFLRVINTVNSNKYAIDIICSYLKKMLRPWNAVSSHGGLLITYKIDKKKAAEH